MRTGHTHISNGEWKHVAETVSFLLSVTANHVEEYFWGLDGLHAATLANAKGIFRVLSFRGCVLTKITCICWTGQGDDSAAPKRSQNRNWCGWFDCWRLANIGRRGKILDFFGKIQCYCVLTVLLIVETFAGMYFSSTHPPPPPSWTNFMEYSAKQAQWNKPSVNRGGYNRTRRKQLIKQKRLLRKMTLFMCTLFWMVTK